MQFDMVRSEVDEVFDVLASRADVLEAVVRRPRTTAELTSGLPVSRSTVDRGLRELERVGFIETTDGVHHPTLAGRIALDTYSQFVECLDDIDAAAAVLDSLDSNAPLAPVFLDGCEVVAVDDGGPGPALSKLTSFVEGSTSIRGCVRGALPSQVDAYYRAVVEDGTPVDLVATDDVVQRLVTAYRPQLAEAWSVSSFSLRSVESLPYSLVVSDLPDGPVAFLVAYSESGLAGVIYNESPSAVSWASQRIENCRADASPLPRPPVDER
ncbi:helix-turn-helix transcriptional regulator [Haloferax marisrubri]|uniref:ArsR family transcriptional regulator n=1 Tax=Haloferax marisrubri TaxID=1544719 RepID=A0A2P4NVN3_9EURY|nr:helix-turn-helix domain-containing protein [Haloferax marisrubri]POG57205.1 ArsR family transcriptional regulator [Haloferax marisrubri]